MITLTRKTTSSALVILFTLSFFAFLTIPLQSGAADTGYTPLVPIEGLTSTGCDTTKSATEQAADPNCKANLGSFIPGLVRLAIQVAGALAVVMIVIGGVQYASSDAISGKSEGRERIQNAIYGLLLAIGAFVILNTINPKTLTLDLEIRRPTVPSAVAPTTSTSTPPFTPNPLSPGDLAGKSWPSAWPGGISITDSEVRALLNTFPIKVTVNRPTNCTVVGQACTSLDGLSQRAISGLRSLSTGCKAAFSCGGNTGVSIRITGGTEFWMHGRGSVQTNPNVNPTLHRPGGGAIDLSKNGPLDSYIRSFPRITGANGCATGEAFRVNGVVYVDESGGDPHWHICY